MLVPSSCFDCNSHFALLYTFEIQICVIETNTVFLDNDDGPLGVKRVLN
jgi:hypothetical protein